MGFSEEYEKLRKKELEAAEKKTDSNSKTFSDAYNKLRQPTTKKKQQSNDEWSWDTARQKMVERMKTHTITPGKKEDSFFQAGAFEDGYDFGDVTRAILGTTSDAVDDLFAGAVGIVEPAIDAGAYLAGLGGRLFGADEFAQDMRKFAKEDLIDEEAVGSGLGWINPLKWGSELIGDVEEDSLLGTKSDALVQSGGQLAATVGLQAVGVPWWVTTGVTSFGSGVETAFKNDADYGVAGVVGAVNAGAEILTEKLFGGSGLKEKGMFNLDGLTKGIADKAVKALADFGVDMAAEGVEEVVSEFINNLGSALYREEDLGTILASEEALEGYLDAFIGGAILSGTMNAGKVTNSVKKGQDYRTGLTANEQKVFDSEYQKRLDEAGDISKKEKAKIYDEVMEDLKKGYISTDRIQEVLGGETFDTYKDLYSKETEIRDEYEELKKSKKRTAEEQARYKELGEQIKMLDDSSFKNSINEEVKRKQRFEADLSQYTDENARKTVENAMKYGLHNGTDAHEFVDFAAKLAAKKGYVVDFTNTKMLKESGKEQYGINADAKDIEAFVSESQKKIVVNMDSGRSYRSLIGHEITHTLEEAGGYGNVQKYLTEVAKQRGEYDSRLADIEKRYKGVKADAQKELTADLAGDYLLEDYEFIKKLLADDRNIFQKVYDEIKYMLKLATAGSKEARALEKAKHYYEKALREATKADKTAEDTKYSLSDSDGKKLTKQQIEYFKDSKMRDEEGNLKVMYHGSKGAGFHVFDPRMSDDDMSFFFTDRNDVAASYSGTTETYAPSVMQTAEDVKRFIATIVTDGKGYDVYEEDGKFMLSYKWEVVAESDTAQGIYEEFCKYEGVGYGEANYKVYLNLTNPLEIDAKGSNWNDIDFTPEEMKPLLQKYEELKAENREKNREAKAYAKARGITIGEAQDRVGGYWDIVEQVGALEERMEKTLERLGMQGEVNTRVISKYAKAHGYDGVIFNNIKDNGGYSNGIEGASTVAIAFNSEQIKSVANATPTSDPDIRYSLSADNQGRELSKDQREYFRQSKVVDENGNLKVMYHGTPSGKFTVFKDGTYFTESKWYADLYQNPGASSISTGKVATDPKTYEVYLDIKKPFDIDDAEARRIYINDYIKGGNAVGINPYLSDAEYAKISSIDWTEGEDLRDFLIDNGYDYDGLVLDEGATGGYGEDVKYRGKSYVIFNPEQVKNVDNKTPTSDPDIRHSLARENEQTYGNQSTPVREFQLPGVEHITDIAPKAEVAKVAPGAKTASAKNDAKANIPPEQEEKIAQIRKANPKAREGSWWTRTVKMLNRIVSVAGDKGWEIENLSKKTGNADLEAKYDFMKNRSSGVAQEYIYEKLLPIIDKFEKYGDLFDLYTRHLHNISRMSLDTEEDAKRRAEIKSKLEGYTEKQIKSLASEKINANTPEERANQIRLAQEYIELGGERGKNKPIFGDSVTADVSRKKVAEYDAAYPEFKDIAKEVHDYLKALRQFAVDEGLIEKSVAEEWEKDYPYYVPTRRTDKQGANVSVPLDTKKTGVNNPFKKATGGNSDFEPLSDTLAKYTMQIFRAAHRNSFGIELKNTLKSLGAQVEEPEQDANGGIIPVGTKVKAHDRNNIGEVKSYNPETEKYSVFFKNAKGQTATVSLGADILTPLDSLKKKEDTSGVLEGTAENDGAVLTPAKNGKPPTFTVFENGKRVTFDITEELYNAIKPAEGVLADTYAVLNKPAKWYKKVLTEYDPFFALLRNPIKDAKDVLFNSRHAWKTYITAPKALSEIKNMGEYFKEYIRNGGKTTSYYNSDTGEFTNRTIKKPKTAKNIFTVPFEKYKGASEKIEMFWRLSEYIASREAGESIEKAMLDAARVTTNFGAGGDLTRWANRNGALFLNPSVQGAMQIARNVREAYKDGIKGSTILAAKVIGVGLSGMVFNWLLWDDDEEYEELSDYVKQNYFLIGKFGDGQFIRIPKGRMEAVIQNGFEQIANLITGDDDVDMETFLDLVGNNLAPTSPFGNNILSPILQAWDNEAWYGDDIVPSRLQDLPAAEQYDESTDSISKWLGETSNLSPYKINYVLKQYGGGIADLLLPALTDEAEGGSWLAPIADQFVSDSVLKNQNVTDFYDLKDELTASANSMYATDEDELRSKYINYINSELSDLYKEKREIQNSNRSDEKKYKAAREVQKQIDELAKIALDTYDSVSISGDYATVGDLHFRLNEKDEWTRLTDKQVESMKAFTSSVGVNETQYFKIKSDLGELSADKNADGSTVSGSRKTKVIKYINSLDVEYGAKIILYKSEYPSDDTYNEDILDYLNSREGLSYADVKSILRELGFTVYADGRVGW